MTLPTDGPCQPWITWEDVTVCRDDLSSVSPPVQALVLEVASDVLYKLTGRRYPGECETTRSICETCGACARPGCHGCAPFSRIDLGGTWPVSDVVTVTVDGIPVASSAWRVDDWRWLVRLDGDTWPISTDLTDPAAFEITWVYGRNPSPSLVRAAALFAAELAASCVPGATCALPSRVTSISREGVNYTILDSQKFLDEGRTGIYLVDLAIKADKAGRVSRPGVFSPALRRARRVATGTDAGGS